MPRSVFLQVEDQRVDGGEKILAPGCDAKAGHLLDVGVHATGGVVGEEQIGPADGADVIQKIQGPVKEGLVKVNGAVHIQQEQAFLPQRRVGHGSISPV